MSARRDDGDVVAAVLAAEHEAEEVTARGVHQVGIGDAEDVPADVLVESLGQEVGLDALDTRRFA